MLDGFIKFLMETRPTPNWVFSVIAGTFYLISLYMSSQDRITISLKRRIEELENTVAQISKRIKY